MSSREEYFAEYFRQQKLRQRRAEILAEKREMAEIFTRPTWWGRVKKFWREDDGFDDKIYRAAAGKNYRHCSSNLAVLAAPRPTSFDGGEEKGEKTRSATSRILGTLGISGEDITKNIFKALVKWAIKSLIAYLGGGTAFLVGTVFVILLIIIFYLGGIM